MVNKVDTVELQDHKVGDRAACPLLVDTDGNLTNLGQLLNALDNRVKVKVLSFGPNAGENDTGWDLPAKAIVLDVIVEVETADAGETLDVGLLSTETGGDADGFLDGISLGSVGIVQGVLSITKTGGVNENYISAVSCTRGVLLRMLEFELGSDVAGDHGFVAYERVPHYAGAVAAKSISYTGSTTIDTGAGKIYIIYADLSQAGEL